MRAWSELAVRRCRTSESAAATGKTLTLCFPVRTVLAGQGAEGCVSLLQQEGGRLLSQYLSRERHAGAVSP